MMLTYAKSLFVKTGFQLRTDDNMLTPILRYNLFNRLAEPGFSNINRFTETTLPPVSTSVRVATLTFEKLMSQDGIPMTVQTTILYKFDPRGCARNIVAQFVRAKNAIFEVIIKDYVGEALLQLVSRYRASSLKEAAVQNNIKNTLLRAVNANVALLGLSIPATGCITFQAFTPHDSYVQTMLEQSNLSEKAQLLQLLDERVVEKFIKTELYNAVVNMSDGNTVIADLNNGASPRSFLGMLNGRSPDNTTPQPPRLNGRAEAD